MADSKITALTALLGANVITSTDVLPIVNISSSQTRKITADEFSIAIGATYANQAQMESASTSTVSVRPSVMHFHPGVAKAYGFISLPTTVSASYPSAGVSVVKNSTGSYTVTHGRTFSSTNYAPSIIPVDNSVLALGWKITAVSTTTFTVLFYISDSFGQLTATDPNSNFAYIVHGDL